MSERPGEQRQLAVERQGAKVIYTVKCRDEYEAMALYDESTAALKDSGSFSLSVSDATPATPHA